MAHKTTDYRFLLVWGIYASIMLTILTLIGPRLWLINRKTEHKVFVSLGFHVNLYHSYRGDRADESGFGKDIRIIRHILDVLDEFEKKGVFVPVTWDFDNLFSLQKILPQHAPDILRRIRSRVDKGLDEIILMSYNNGMASAMNEVELRKSVEWAIRNPEQSGVEQIFGSYSPIIRPQEMMTSPGNFQIYKDLGLEYILLYYSAIPFDAFRLFIPDLSREEAHNPLLLVNENIGELIKVIPSYNIGDLVENVSLNNWAEKLHRMQLRRKIDRDLLIAINFDADDEFWYGLKLPSYLKWLPNTQGLKQIIESVAKLKYVKFSRLSDYVKNHEPVGKISFQQDTADGSFTGYNSWAEKSYIPDIWRRIVQDRRITQKVKAFYASQKASIPFSLQKFLKQSFALRMRLLSTTNFGMATPFLARSREERVFKIAFQIDAIHSKVEKFLSLQMRKVAKQHFFPQKLYGKSLHTKFLFFSNKVDKDKISGKKAQELKKQKISINKREKIPAMGSENGGAISLQSFSLLSKEALCNQDRRYFLYAKKIKNEKSMLPLICHNSKVVDFAVKSNSDRVEKRQHFSTDFLLLSNEPIPDGLYALYYENFKSHDEKINLNKTNNMGRNDSISLKQGLNLANGRLSLKLNGLNRNLDSLSLDGKEVLEAGSLLPRIQYNKRWYKARIEEIEISGPANVDSSKSSSKTKNNTNNSISKWQRLVLSGTLNLGTRQKRVTKIASETSQNKEAGQSGWFRYEYLLVNNLPYLIINAKVHYPRSTSKDIIKGDNPYLSRKIDFAWQQLSPLSLNVAFKAERDKPFQVTKKNYLQIESSYTLNYHKYESKNAFLDNINNHLTASYVALQSQDSTLAFSANEISAANFAYAPMQQSPVPGSDKLSMIISPFGTLHGNQPALSTWGKRQGFQASFITGQQYQSSAPSYNGAYSQFSLLLYFSRDFDFASEQKRNLDQFSSPAMIIQALYFPANPDYPVYQRKRALRLASVKKESVLYSFSKDKLVVSWEYPYNDGLSFKVRLCSVSDAGIVKRSIKQKPKESTNDNTGGKYPELGESKRDTREDLAKNVKRSCSVFNAKSRLFEHSLRDQKGGSYSIEIAPQMDKDNQVAFPYSEKIYLSRDTKQNEEKKKLSVPFWLQLKILFWSLVSFLD